METPKGAALLLGAVVKRYREVDLPADPVSMGVGGR
jgi:hypothetical protein